MVTRFPRDRIADGVLDPPSKFALLLGRLAGPIPVDHECQGGVGLESEALGQWVRMLAIRHVAGDPFRPSAAGGWRSSQRRAWAIGSSA
jgi:hypothetical protein